MFKVILNHRSDNDGNDINLLKMFTSKKIENIVEFYNSFQKCDDLIQWMHQLPKPELKVFEYDTSSDLIVVIPTADKDGEMAKRCVEEVFSGCHIILVESGKNGYFNLAYSYNVGLKKALSYNCEWIMISNDDMNRTDKISDLKIELNRMDPGRDALLLPESKEIRRNALIGSFPSLIESAKSMQNKYERLRYRLEKKFNVKYKYYHYGERNILRNLFRTKYIFPNIADFGIFSGLFVRECYGEIFDDVFLSGVEDLDISLRLNLANIFPKYLNFKIEGIGKFSQGGGYDRWLRDVANFAYLNQKINSNSIADFRNSKFDRFRKDSSEAAYI